MSAIRNAMERAESRAAVLTNLAKTYGDDVPTATAASTLSTVKSTSNSHSSGKEDAATRVLHSLQSFINDPREKAWRTLSDAIVGKSIVLSNVKAQSDAMKSSKRVKR